MTVVYAEPPDFHVDTYSAALRVALDADDSEALKQVARQMVERSTVPSSERAETWSLSAAQTATFHAWRREQERAAAHVDTGAIGGALTVVLCYTSIGVLITAKHGVTKKSLCLNAEDL